MLCRETNKLRIFEVCHDYLPIYIFIDGQEYRLYKTSCYTEHCTLLRNPDVPISICGRQTANSIRGRIHCPSSQVKKPQCFGSHICLRFQVESGKRRKYTGGTNIKSQSYFLDSFQNLFQDNGRLPSSGTFRVGLSILLWAYREIFLIPSRQMLEFYLKISTPIRSQHSHNIIALIYIISALETFCVKYITNRALCS